MKSYNVRRSEIGVRIETGLKVDKKTFIDFQNRIQEILLKITFLEYIKAENDFLSVLG